MKMKKSLCFLLVIVMSFILVGCELDFSRITVKYNTDGGTEIANTIINFSELDKFALPQDPVKEGYTFGGWYLDQTCEEPFKSIDIQAGTITLYAKWNPQNTEKNGFSVKTNFKFDYDDTLEFSGSQTNNKFGFEGTVDFLVEDLKVEAIEDYKAQVKINMDIFSVIDEERKDEHIEMDVYLFGNKVYIDGSKMLEDTSDPMQNGKVIIDIQTIINELLEKEAQLEQELKALGIEIDAENMPETLPEEYNQVLTQIKELFTASGLTEEDLNGLLEVFQKLTPTINQTLDGVVYEFKQEHLEQFLDAIKLFINDKFAEIYTFVNSVMAMVQGSEVVVPSEEEMATIKDNIMQTVNMVIMQVKSMVKINEAKVTLKYNPNSFISGAPDYTNLLKEIQCTLDVEQENPVYETVNDELVEGKNTIKVVTKFGISFEQTNDKVNDDYSVFVNDCTSEIIDGIDFFYNQLLETLKEYIGEKNLD